MENGKACVFFVDDSMISHEDAEVNDEFLACPNEKHGKLGEVTARTVK